MFCKIIYGICEYIYIYIFLKANSFLPSSTAEGLKVTHLSASIFPALCCRAEFFQYVREPLCSIRRLPLRRCRSGTAINHNTEKQKFICIQLPSTFEAADLELNFFFPPLRLLPPPSPSPPPLPSSCRLSLSPSERGYDLRGSQISSLPPPPPL